MHALVRREKRLEENAGVREAAEAFRKVEALLLSISKCLKRLHGADTLLDASIVLFDPIRQA